MRVKPVTYAPFSLLKASEGGIDRRSCHDACALAASCPQSLRCALA
jgi:hypothetical protein